MRKVDEKLIAAIRDKRDATFDNTKVMHWSNEHAGGKDNVTVYLHGHMIARRADNSWHVSLAGWNTNTTRNRLTTIIREFCHAPGWPSGAGVSTKKGCPRLHDSRGITAIDSTSWWRVYS